MLKKCVSVGTAGLLLLMLLSGCGESLTSSKADKLQSRTDEGLSLTVEDIAVIERVRASPSAPGSIGSVRGMNLFPGVEIHYVVDQFGEKPSCQLEFSQRNVAGSPANGIRKWSLHYVVSGAEDLEILESSNYFGTKTPLRMYFDNRAEYLPMRVVDEQSAVAPLSGAWLSGMSNATELKILHGMGPSGEVAFSYDVSTFSRVRRIVRELCWHREQVPATQLGTGLKDIPVLTARVMDVTGTLDAGQVQALDSRLAAFEKARGTKIFVLMVPTTQPEDIHDYTQRVSEHWKIAQQHVGGGLLVVVAKNDRKVRIATGKTLEGVVPGLVAKQVIDRAITPRFREGDFAGGLTMATDQFMTLIAGEKIP